MQTFSSYQNLKVDGDEFTSGFLGLDWMPSKGSSSQKQAYEREVLAALDRISKTWTGWAILTEIFYSNRQIIIRPYHPTAKDPFNAFARPTDWSAATLKDTTVLDNSGSMPPPGQPRIIGTGAGSDVDLRFSPDTFKAPGAPTGTGTSPDEILLHEIVHGLRQVYGRMVREVVTGNPGMDNYEEFTAITISNIYRSEQGATSLRADHHGFAALTGPTATVANFKTTYAIFLSHIGIEQPRLVQNLRQVKAVFNPFA